MKCRIEKLIHYVLNYALIHYALIHCVLLYTTVKCEVYYYTIWTLMVLILFLCTRIQENIILFQRELVFEIESFASDRRQDISPLALPWSNGFGRASERDANGHGRKYDQLGERLAG